MDQDEKKLEHLKLIQAVIERMAQNSFLLKAWSVTLASALFALAAADKQKEFVYLALMPVLVFWGLDGYYLYQERQYRRLYDDTRGADYCMTPVQDVPSETPAKQKSEKWLPACFRPTVYLFHGALVLGILVTLALLYVQEYVQSRAGG